MNPILLALVRRIFEMVTTASERRKVGKMFARPGRAAELLAIVTESVAVENKRLFPKHWVWRNRPLRRGWCMEHQLQYCEDCAAKPKRKYVRAHG